MVTHEAPSALATREAAHRKGVAGIAEVRSMPNQTRMVLQSRRHVVVRGLRGKRQAESAEGTDVSEYGKCEVCGRPKEQLWYGPHDGATCANGLVVAHPAGAASACYRLGYERLASILHDARGFVEFQAARNPLPFNFQVLNRIDAALPRTDAPRES